MISSRTKSINIGDYKTIVIQNNALNSSCVGCIIKCGSTNDNKGKSGMCSLINHILLYGQHARKILARSDRIGFKIQYIFEREYTYLYIHTHAHLYYEAAEILIELIHNFQCEEQDIIEAKKYVKNIIMYEQDSIDTFIDNAIHENIFTRQLIGKSKYGKVKTVDSISREDVNAFYNRNYNHKNIVMIVSSPINLETIQSKLGDMITETSTMAKYAFSSFKRYVIHKKIKYIYKNTKNTYINLIFPMGGFRNYERKIYASLIVKILNGHTQSALDINYKVELLEYNSVSVMIVKYQLNGNKILDSVQETLNKMRNLNLSEETYSEIVKHMVDESLTISLNSIQSSYQFALHYLNLRKIKKHNFDLEILYSFNKAKIQEDFKNMFSLLNMSLFVFGPKYNKHQINQIDVA